jgi:hypothetical protein
MMYITQSPCMSLKPNSLSPIDLKYQYFNYNFKIPIALVIFLHFLFYTKCKWDRTQTNEMTSRAKGHQVPGCYEPRGGSFSHASKMHPYYNRIEHSAATSEIIPEMRCYPQTKNNLTTRPYSRVFNGGYNIFHAMASL